MKRKLNEVDDEEKMQNSIESVVLDSIEPNKSKKRKKMNNEIKSSLFRCREDHDQFTTIFKLLQESELLEQMNIPSDINKEIAEYSTGEWVKHKGDCNAMVSALWEDISYGKSNDFKCMECEKNCWFIGCGCDKIIMCDSQQDSLRCNCCKEFRCNDCENYKCHLCPNVYCGWCVAMERMECYRCNRIFCGYCDNYARVGCCAMCGEYYCFDCIKLPGKKLLDFIKDEDSYCEIEDIKCVCARCYERHKEMFRWL